MKRCFLHFVFAAISVAFASCSDGHDPSEDAEKVCHCLESIKDDPDVDCRELMQKMADRYKGDETAAAQYAIAYHNCISS